jgi:hypothetical protein
LIASWGSRFIDHLEVGEKGYAGRHSNERQPSSLQRSAIAKAECPIAHGTASHGLRDVGIRYGSVKSGRLSMLGTILIIILVLALIGSLPTWGHSRNWGYAPSGGLGLIVVILLILLLLGRI